MLFFYVMLEILGKILKKKKKIQREIGGRKTYGFGTKKLDRVFFNLGYFRFSFNSLPKISSFYVTEDFRREN
jgi:hypothetical protein